jgi:hypothetical protein
MWALLIDRRLPRETDYARDDRGRLCVYPTRELAAADACKPFSDGRTWLVRLVEMPCPDDAEPDGFAFIPAQTAQVSLPPA